MRHLLKFVSVLFKTVTAAVALLAVALSLFLGICARRIPDALSQRIEDALCTDSICVRFDTAAFSLSDGFTFNHVRLYARGMLGPPLIETDRLHLDFSFRFGRPIAESIDTVIFEGLDFAELPDFDRIGALLVDAAKEAENAPEDAPVSAYAWLTRPIDFRIIGFNLLGTRVDDVDARASLRGETFYFRDLHMAWKGRDWQEHASGEFIFDHERNSFKFTLEGHATPPPLYPIFRAVGAEGVVDVCEDFSDYNGPLETKFELSLDGGDAPLEIALALRGGGFRYLGMPIPFARARITYSEGGVPGLVRVSGLYAEHETGSARAHIEIDPDFTRVTIDVKSTVAAPVITTVAKLPPELASNILASVVFDVPPKMSVSGTFDISDDSDAIDLHGHVKADDRFYVVGVPVDAAEGDFAITEKSFSLPDLSGRAFGGTVTGGVFLAEMPGPTNQDWFVRGVGEGSQLGFGDFCRDLFGITNSFGGTLNGTFDLSAPLEKGAFPEGSGRMEVRQGVIARIPLFAGFTDYLARSIPGVESMVTQSDISLSFTCRDGGFHTDDLLVEGGFFSLRAAGDYYDSDNSLNFTATARLFREKTLAGRFVRLIAFPFSKLLEFRVYGTPDAPEWRYIGLLDRLFNALGFGGE